MIVLLLTGLLAILFAYFQSIGKLHNGLKWGMAIVTFIAAIHWNYGSDYMSYFETYMRYVSNHYSIKDILAGGTIRNEETGWALLYWLFGQLGVSGFYLLIAFISIIQGICVYKLIVRYVPNEWLAFAVFVYLFNLSLYVGSMSGLRQHFAMVIVGMSLPYILKKKPIVPILLVIGASFVHSSAIVFIPFVFWGFLPDKGYKITAIVLGVLFVFFYVNQELLHYIFNVAFAYDRLSNYDIYDVASVNTSSRGLGYIINLIPFMLSLYYLMTCHADNNYGKIVSLSAIAFMVLPFSTLIPMTVRIAYYFDFFSFLSLPIVYNYIREKSVKIVCLSLYIFIGLYMYIGFFYSDLRYESTFHFHSIFELL